VTPSPKASSLNARRRERDLEVLADGEVVDVAVIGGGVTGAAVALDAASRGLSVALLERGDLAQGTSRWSSKLVHGGLRYLAKGQVGIAYDSAVERGLLMERLAPHLTRAIGMVAPAGVGFSTAQAAVVGTGMVLGNALRVAAGTARSTLPPPRWITSQETRLLVPMVRSRGLRGSVLSWDGQLVDDARLVVAVARTAAAHGARVITAAEVAAVDGQAILLRDTLGGDRLRVRARTVVNATGVWADRLHPEVELHPSKGAHLLLAADRLGHPRAALTVPVPGERSRYVFAVPQPDGHVLVGVTDEAVESVSDEPLADEADETFLLSVLSAALEVPLTPSDVVGSFAGLRPLLAGDDGATADLSRVHRILERADGLTTIVGGKLTTARRMAQDVVNLLVRREGLTAGPCVTARRPLVGAAPRDHLAALRVDPWLADRYGAEAVELSARMQADPELAAPVVAGRPWRLVELAWALEHEGALSVSDLVDRRTRIGLVPAERAAAIPAAEALLDAHRRSVAAN
jgi:glycerol-3-phosphate dehydrogenase